MKACDRGPRSTLSREQPAQQPAQQHAQQHAQQRGASVEEPCDMCGSDTVEWRKCKLVCTTCGTILKSCADL